MKNIDIASFKDDIENVYYNGIKDTWQSERVTLTNMRTHLIRLGLEHLVPDFTVGAHVFFKNSTSKQKVRIYINPSVTFSQHPDNIAARRKYVQLNADLETSLEKLKALNEHARLLIRNEHARNELRLKNN